MHDNTAPASALLSVEQLSVEFQLRSGAVAAVRDVSFAIAAGETAAIVGESGSGKTATALSLMRLNPEPPCVYRGHIRFDGRDILATTGKQIEGLRGRDIAMVFQDPMTSFNPVMTIGDQIAEVIVQHSGDSWRSARRAAVAALAEVGIANPERRARQYPHQFSGGMRQRAMIAMALACRPKLLIADEPTTALDVTVQAQVMDLLRGLQQRLGTTVILISHDLGLVAEFADRVIVMYAGRIVEDAPAGTLFSDPQMPYTIGLLASVPRIDTAVGSEMVEIGGQPPDPRKPIDGCAFASRCALVHDRCRNVTPALVDREPGHRVACHLTRAEVQVLRETRP
jgi:oligopeptide/dipeptide ABC transporter ATP-binding protein